MLLRQEIGDVLRTHRQRQGQTLRQVAAKASVALGYLSEVERGQKEVSSEILASVADALEVPLSIVMRDVSERLASAEGIFFDDTFIPDTVPETFVAEAELYSHQLTLSRFQELIEDEFGSAFAAVVLNDTRITALGDQTPKALLASGSAPKEVWLAICQQLEIPAERWQGKIKTKRHAE